MFGSVLLYEAATAAEPPASLPLQDSSMAVLHHPPLCANRLSVHWLWQAAARVCRPLWAAMLHHLAAVPPVLALSVLQTVGERVLRGVPPPAPRLQAEPFGDSALAQVRYGKPRLKHSMLY